MDGDVPEPIEPIPHNAVAERRIREAMSRGDFDDLPGAGKPLPGAGEPYDPLWWVRAWIERERLGDLDERG
jgi:hypothetical protein